MHVYFIPYFNVLLGYTLGILCAIFKAYFVILFSLGLQYFALYFGLNLRPTGTFCYILGLLCDIL